MISFNICVYRILTLEESLSELNINVKMYKHNLQHYKYWKYYICGLLNFQHTYNKNQHDSEEEEEEEGEIMFWAAKLHRPRGKVDTEVKLTN